MPKSCPAHVSNSYLRQTRSCTDLRITHSGTLAVWHRTTELYKSFSENSINTRHALSLNLCHFFCSFQPIDEVVTTCVCNHHIHLWNVVLVKILTEYLSFTCCPGISETSYSPVTRMFCLISSAKHFLALASRWNIRLSTLRYMLEHRTSKICNNSIGMIENSLKDA